MKTKTHLIAVIALVAAVGVVGGAIANADPHSNDGLGGRSFAVEVEWLVVDEMAAAAYGLGPEGMIFENCYTFNEDGAWIDPLFVPGHWIQHTTGKKVSYTAIADGSAFGLMLVQNGTVKKGKGSKGSKGSKGKARLTAYTTLYVFPGFAGMDGRVAAEIVSRGHEVETCTP